MILLDRRLWISVLIRDRAEKPHSQSTVDMGRSRPMAANLYRLGNMVSSSAVLNIRVMSSRVVSCFSSLLAATTLGFGCFRVNNFLTTIVVNENFELTLTMASVQFQLLRNSTCIEEGKCFQKFYIRKSVCNMLRKGVKIFSHKFLKTFHFLVTWSVHSILLQVSNYRGKVLKMFTR